MKINKLFPLFAIVGAFALAGCNNSGKSLVVSNSITQADQTLYLDVRSSAIDNIVLNLVQMNLSTTSSEDNSYLNLSELDYSSIKKAEFSSKTDLYLNAFVQNVLSVNTSTNDSNQTIKLTSNNQTTQWMGEPQDKTLVDKVSHYTKTVSKDNNDAEVVSCQELGNVDKSSSIPYFQSIMIDTFKPDDAIPSYSNSSMAGLTSDKAFAITTYEESLVSKTNPKYPSNSKMNIIVSTSYESTYYLSKDSTYGWILTDCISHHVSKIYTDYELNALSKAVVISEATTSSSFVYGSRINDDNLPTFVESYPPVERIPLLYAWDGSNYTPVSVALKDVTNAYKTQKSDFDGVAYKVDVSVSSSTSYCFSDGKNVSEGKFEVYGYDVIDASQLINGLLVSKASNGHAKLFGVTNNTKLSFLFLRSSGGDVSIVVSLFAL